MVVGGGAKVMGCGSERMRCARREREPYYILSSQVSNQLIKKERKRVT